MWVVVLAVLLAVALGALAMAVAAYARERRRAEAAQAERDRARTQLERFAAVAAHDLAEPLRTVTGFAQLVEQRHAEQLDDAGRDYLRHVVEGASGAQRLLDGLSTWARVGRAGTARDRVDLDEVLRRAVEDLDVRIEEAQATVIVGDLPVVRGDGVQLGQLFGNLLANAITHTAGRPPHVEVTAARTGDRWRIDVCDRGPGVPPGERDKIFAMFHRGDPPSAGTGVGLAVCAKVVDNHGGRIWVDPNPDGGSVFRVELPA